jgi:hypothetical protein
MTFISYMTKNMCMKIYSEYLYIIGARSGAVVEVLRYKPEGRGIDSRWCHRNFSLT